MWQIVYCHEDNLIYVGVSGKNFVINTTSANENVVLNIKKMRIGIANFKLLNPIYNPKQKTVKFDT